MAATFVRPGERPGLLGGVPALAARETPIQIQAAANPELGVVQWPSGADLEPDVLYADLSGQPIEIGLRHSVR